MLKASKLFTDEQKKRINDAVVAAEAGTSAEIVPIVASASGRYDRAEDIFGVWVGLLAVLLVYLFMPEPPRETGGWGGTPVYVKMLVMVAAMLGGFALGAAVATYAWSIRRFFTPRKQMLDETHARARQVFYDATVHHTAAASGVLLYVSLYERLAVVLADKTVLEKLGQSVIDTLCAKLTTGLAMGDPASAISDAVKTSGELLAPHLPRPEGDRNELMDALVLID